MDEQREQYLDHVFEIVWYQHDAQDWMAEVTDRRTRERRPVCSWEELERFIHGQLSIAGPQAIEL